MRFADSPGIGSEPPPVQEGGNPVNAWQYRVSLEPRRAQTYRPMLISALIQSMIGGPSVGSYDGALGYCVLNKGDETLDRGIRDAPHANASGSATADLGGDHDERFPCGTPVDVGIGASEERLIHFHFADQAISAGPHHGSAKLLEPDPGRLVAPEPKSSLKSEGTDPMLLIGDVPDCLKPKPQRLAGSVEERSCRNRGLSCTARASKQASVGGPAFGVPAGWAAESGRPTQATKKRFACALR